MNQYGEYTNVGLGLDVFPESVFSACVEVHDSDSYETLNNRSNMVVLTDGTEQRLTDNQGPLVVIPVPWVATAPLVPHDAYDGREI